MNLSSAAMIGTSAGAMLGIFSFFMLYAVAAHMRDQAQERGDRPPPAAAIIKLAAWADLVIFPVVGYVVGPMVFGG